MGKSPSLSLDVPTMKAREMVSLPVSFLGGQALDKGTAFGAKQTQLQDPWVPASMKQGPDASLERWRGRAKQKS